MCGRAYCFALETVAYGSQLSALEAESENLKKANKSLELEYVSVSSLLKLKENSENLGFVKPGTTLYISFEESVASLRN